MRKNKTVSGKYKRSVEVKEMTTKVKHFNKDWGAHISLPDSMLGKRIRITFLEPKNDTMIPYEDWARAHGNSAHVMVNREWIGEHVKVEVLD
jgi:putative transposon-encoded protein